MTDDTTSAPASWRVQAWLKAAGHPFSLPVLYREIKAGRLDARKVGGGHNTVTLTSPREYFSKMPRELGPGVRRRKEQVA